MRYDLVCVFVGLILYAAGAHLLGGVLVGAGVVVALRGK